MESTILRNEVLGLASLVWSIVVEARENVSDTATVLFKQSDVSRLVL